MNDSISGENGIPDSAFDKFKKGKEAYHSMSKEEIKLDMDKRYETGDAYPNPALWIHAHHRELEDCFQEILARKTGNKDILELGAGSGGIGAHYIHDAKSIVATDLSDTALNVAREFFREKSGITFTQMDAENLQFPDASFDVAIAKETLEHLPDALACAKEVNRVLRSKGYFILSSPNRDSLHLRVNRKVGGADFMCSGDHMREYSFSEMCELLNLAGFDVEAAEGVTLMPYHHVKDMFSEAINKAEDYDPEVVEWFRVLGRRAGPEFGFCYVILAIKRD